MYKNENILLFEYFFLKKKKKKKKKRYFYMNFNKLYMFIPIIKSETVFEFRVFYF